MNPVERDDPTARARERATVAALLASAHGLREAALARVQRPPLFVLEGARNMARHLAMPDSRMQELLPAMAFWQAYFPSALARDATSFTQAAARFPASYDVVRSVVAEMKARPQVVFVAFHMAAMPLIAAFLALAVAETHGRPGHVLLSPQNAVRLQTESGRWVLDVSTVVRADAAGLRRLISGLRDGSITRLLILPDGPQRPGGPNTRVVANAMPGVAFKTGLLSRILAMGIPTRPLAHRWVEGDLALTWHPFLDGTGEAPISRVAGLIEDLLRQQPEQWLNWSAASLRP